MTPLYFCLEDLHVPKDKPLKQTFLKGEWPHPHYPIKAAVDVWYSLAITGQQLHIGHLKK